MISDLMQLVEKELGRPLPGTSAAAIKTGLAQRYGGERIYVPAWPKAVTAWKINTIGASLSSQDAAKLLKISSSQVRRIRHGTK